MKENVIGVIGGMGSYATAYFFRKFLDECPAKKEWERPRIIIDNNCVMPSRVRAILYNEGTTELIDALSASVNGLVALGCNKIILACITSHHFLPLLKIKTSNAFELIDLLAATASTINELELSIFCTEGTAQSKLWNQYFCQNIRLIYPNDEELKELRFFIEAVKQNEITDKIVEKFIDFIEKTPCKNIILGCTELPVLYEVATARMKKMEKNIYDPIQCGIEKLKESL